MNRMLGPAPLDRQERLALAAEIANRARRYFSTGARFWRKPLHYPATRTDLTRSAGRWCRDVCPGLPRSCKPVRAFGQDWPRGLINRDTGCWSANASHF